jgi:hypothetical protein
MSLMKRTKRETSSILAKRKMVVSRYLKFDEDAWSSKSLEPSPEIEEGKKIVIPNVEPKEKEILDSDQQGSSEGTRPHYHLVQQESQDDLPRVCRMHMKWECQNLLFR